MIKVDIISGFLGAGKTTLIKKLFESSLKGEQVVIIENEFGEIGIDGTFLKGSGVEIKEINAGCICCSLVGDFESSIKEMINTYHPDRIIIEPSGVGKLSDIIGAIKKVNSDELKLNILATVVAGNKAKIYLKNFGEFFINQVECADTIVVTKIEKLSEAQVDEVVKMIKEKNSHANVITTPLKDFDSAKLLSLLEEKASLGHKLLEETLKELAEDDDEDEHEHHHHHHHHDEDEECCCHHHDDDDEDEHEHHHHHHDEDEECCCHHHDDEDEDEHEHHHHHHDEDEECCCHHHDEEGHEHHHHHEYDENGVCSCGHHHHHHDADEIFTSWGTETAKTVSHDELVTFFNHLTNDSDLGIVVRCKGILKANDKDTWYYFDYESGDYEIREGAPDYTGRIVVIGSKIDEDKIEHLFFNK